MSLSTELEENERFIESDKPVEEACVDKKSSTGVAATSSLWFSASVLRMKSAFLGLMQTSSTLSLFCVETPRRARNEMTLPGAGSSVVKKELENSCWKSRWRSRSAPRGSTSMRPVLSSTKKGTNMHSVATLRSEEHTSELQ